MATEHKFAWDIAEWVEVAIKEKWPEEVKDYGDVPYLVFLNDKMIDLSNEVDIDVEVIIGSILVDMFHLLCMRDIVKTYKMLQIMANSIEHDVMKQVLKQLRDLLVNSLDPDDE